MSKYHPSGKREEAVSTFETWMIQYVPIINEVLFMFMELVATLLLICLVCVWVYGIWTFEGHAPNSRGRASLPGALVRGTAVCWTVKRADVHEGLCESIVREVARLDKEAVSSVGEGTIDDVRMGPLNRKPQLDRVILLIADAGKNGGSLRAGGAGPSHADAEEFFLTPAHVQEGIRLVDEEQFEQSELVIRANNSQPAHAYT